jgi:hypothetical protein
MLIAMIQPFSAQVISPQHVNDATGNNSPDIISDKKTQASVEILQRSYKRGERREIIRPHG